VVREEVPPRSGGWRQTGWVEGKPEGFCDRICAAGEHNPRSGCEEGRWLMGSRQAEGVSKKRRRECGNSQVGF